MCVHVHVTMLRNKPIRGALLDITGVLYESGTRVAIPGSVEAVRRLKEAGLGVRLVTNESSIPVAHLSAKLEGMGFEVKERDIISPIPAVLKLLASERLTPHLLVSPQVEGEFAHLLSNQTSPNCVVLGDAGDAFSFEALNKAFRALKTMPSPRLIALGRGKCYRHEGELHLDVGPFMSALEYATGVQAEVIGKPEKEFFKAALSDLGVSAGEAIMVGDDIEGDVGGAQGCGVAGVLVRTGKYTPASETHPSITPDTVQDNLGCLVEALLAGGLGE